MLPGSQCHGSASLIVTNQCAWCLTVFATRRKATHHVFRAVLGSGQCSADGTSWRHQVIVPLQLRCVLCGYEARELAHLPDSPRGPLGLG